MGGIILPNFKTYRYNNQDSYWWEDRYINQWNKTESPEIDHTNILNSFSDNVQK